jgi:hypothetical protein
MRPPGSVESLGTTVSDMSARVGIVMGSDSDWPVMKEAGEALGEFDVAFEADVVSAHRMPEEMLAYGKELRPGRKVGHVNAYGDDLEDCLERARHAAAWFAGDLGEESE